MDSSSEPLYIGTLTKIETIYIGMTVMTKQLVDEQQVAECMEHMLPLSEFCIYLFPDVQVRL